MSLLIKGGDIVDGSGSAPKRGDVLLIAGRIAAIGNLASYKADKTISASGCVISPGFVDMASGTDRHLSFFRGSDFGGLLLQGVTTVVCGTGGISLAPLMYGSLESVSPWSKWESINTDWHSMAELLELMDGSRPGVNFASFAGYDTVKSAISKKKRGLSRAEAGVMSHVLEEAFREGALGVSLSAEDSASPDMSSDENKAFGSLLASSGGILSAEIPAFMKKPSEVVLNVVKWAEKGVPVVVHRFGRANASPKELSHSLAAIEGAAASARVIASACPLGIEELPLRSAVPETAWSSDPAELAANLLKKRNSIAMEKLWPLERLSKLWITDAPNAAFLVGKNMKNLAENRETGSAECFSKIIGMARGRIVFHIEEGSVDSQVISHPRVAIESGACGSLEEGGFHKKLQNAFPLFLEMMSRSGMNIEKAIMKTSGLPAITCGFKRRGEIREGFAADLVILKDRKPAWVFVNGVEAVREGELTGERGGKTLKGNV